jgi:hypothetical protein
MLHNFAEDGKYDFGKDLALGIAEKKRLNIAILNELRIPHVNGWLKIKLRVLRNVDLTSNKKILSEMQEALKEDFLDILGLPGLIRNVCYEPGYLEAVLKFRDDVGAECLKSVFGGCAAKRIQESGYLEAVLKFRDDVGIECFKSIFQICAAKRIQENGYLEAVLKFRDDVGTECFKTVFKDVVAKRIQEKCFLDRMMYCMKARDECPGIASQFVILASYLDRLSDDFFKSFINRLSGWSSNLCKRLLIEIDKSLPGIVPDEVWQGLLNKMSAHQKRLLANVVAKAAKRKRED